MAAALAQAGLNLFIAACLGASIGLERQWRQHLAGLRTNTLVALGAAIFITYARAAGDNEGATRIAAQVVSGIGFLGAGVIFKEGLNVRGLNTAANLWCSAAVGLLAGEGLALYGLIGAILVIGANTLLRPIVRAINRQPVEMSEEDQHYLVTMECRAAIASEIRARVVEAVADVPDLQFTELDSAFIADSGRVDVTATVTSHHRRELALGRSSGGSPTWTASFARPGGATRKACKRKTAMTSSSIRFDIEDAPSDADVEVLPNGLEAFNESRWPGHQQWRPLAVFAREGERIVAGLAGETYSGWLFIRYLWVSYALRGKGIGRELMAGAEARALERGCHSAWVDTFSFQAPGFYLKLGYQVFGELDYPPGHKRIFLKKRLGGREERLRVGARGGVCNSARD